MSLTRAIDILLVEDNPGDIDLTREAFEDANIPTNLFVVEDGEDAISFLKLEGKHAGKPRPDVILLDLNLPKKGGHEVLNFIKNHDILRCIPVVILTSSQAESDILKSYNLYANSFVTKPIDSVKFVTVMKTFEDFWLKIAALPKNTQS